MDDINNVKEPKPKKVKTYRGVVLNPVKIGKKYDFRGKKGQTVSVKTKKELDNYKLNKILQ